MKSWKSLALASLLLAGCASDQSAQQTGKTDGGGTQQSDGRYAMSSDAYPQEPPDVAQVPDAVPRVEPRSRAGNKSTYEVWGKTYRVLPDATGYDQRGTASWYGKKFHGYATSNGEIYDMYKMSAAHRSLPLPTFAKVTNLDNGRSVIVRVNDRGPFHSEREIDLSYAAAARLDILERGTGRVRVQAIDPVAWQKGERGVAQAPQAPATVRQATQPSSTQGSAAQAGESGSIYLQVAALGSADGAARLKQKLETSLSQPVRVASAAGLYRVQVGPLDSAAQVAPLRGQLSRAGFGKAFVVNGTD